MNQDPKKPEHEPQPPTPSAVTATGAPVDDRFVDLPPEQRLQQLPGDDKRREEAAAQQRRKSEEAAHTQRQPQGNDDDDDAKSKGSKKGR